MKLNDILNFSDFYASIQNEKLSFQTALTLRRIVAEAKEYIDFYQEKLQGILDECAERDDKGQLIVDENSIKIRADKVEECNHKIAELRNVDVSISTRIAPAQLENLQLTPIQLNQIFPFIEE